MMGDWEEEQKRRIAEAKKREEYGVGLLILYHMCLCFILVFSDSRILDLVKVLRGLIFGSVLLPPRFRGDWLRGVIFFLLFKLHYNLLTFRLLNVKNVLQTGKIP